jgi:hypothetical protein
MKKLIVVLCCLLAFKAALAQEIIKLDMDSTTLAKKLVVPNFKNLEKLLNASQKDYEATMLALGYTLTKEDDVDIYGVDAANGDPLFGIMKQGDKLVAVMFFQKTDYPKQMKDLFESKYTKFVHKKSSGSDAYYFKGDDGNGGMKGLCMIFDNRRKSNSVTLALTDQ